jgi:hypothetical protein
VSSQPIEPEPGFGIVDGHGDPVPGRSAAEYAARRATAELGTVKLDRARWRAPGLRHADLLARLRDAERERDELAERREDWRTSKIECERRRDLAELALERAQETERALREALDEWEQRGRRAVAVIAHALDRESLDRIGRDAAHPRGSGETRASGGSPTCQDCRRRERSFWLADPVLWKQVMGDVDAGVICPQCFEERAFAAGVSVKIAVVSRDEFRRWQDGLA